MKTKIGITPNKTEEIAENLSILLADEFILYTKTRNAHWNVEGADFHSMHLFFESQYGEIETNIDDIAERIRQIGHYAPATLKEYLGITHLSEKKFEKNDSVGFIKELLSDHESIIVYLRESIDSMEGTLDFGTEDFLTALLEKHEKQAWMLRAHIR
ncbi:Dps family protein [Chryseobacterium sp. T1]